MQISVQAGRVRLQLQAVSIQYREFRISVEGNPQPVIHMCQETYFIMTAFGSNVAKIFYLPISSCSDKGINGQDAVCRAGDGRILQGLRVLLIPLTGIRY